MVPALDDLNFQVPSREVFGILGPNGGGKTTLFRILATMLRPTAGSASVFDRDVTTESHQVRRELGVIFQTPSLDLKLTAKENLHLHGQLYGLSGSGLKKGIAHWLDRFGLASRRAERVERFSGGMRRRLELAKTLLHEPRLLLMDEPSTGLDPGAQRDLWDSLEQLPDMSIALTTHLMNEADRCDRLGVLSEGKMLAIDTPDNLKSRISGHVITVEPIADPQLVAAQISEHFRTKTTIVDGTISWEQVDGAQTVAALGTTFGDRLRRITVAKPSLEDVFLQLTGHRFENQLPC